MQKETKNVSFISNEDIKNLKSKKQTLFHILINTIYKDHFYIPSLKEFKEEDGDILIAVTENSKIDGFKKLKDVNKFNFEYTKPDNLYSNLYINIIEASKNFTNPKKTGYMDKLIENSFKTKAFFLLISDCKDNYTNNLLNEAKKSIEYLNTQGVITAFIGFDEKAKLISKELGFKKFITIDTFNSNNNYND